MKIKNLIKEGASLKGVKFKGMPKTFWVVTKPDDLSTIDDILFETDYWELSLQFRGGLKPQDIYGIYTNKADALRDANNILGKVMYFNN